jgi:hypothetical protein
MGTGRIVERKNTRRGAHLPLKGGGLFYLAAIRNLWHRKEIKITSHILQIDKGENKMKNIIPIVAITSLMAASAFAQMSGNDMKGGQDQRSNMMGSKQSHQMMRTKMMDKDMMHDMSGMMKQMKDMMQQMSGIMEHDAGEMDHARMKDMSKIMSDMSQAMREMSGQMAQGKMNGRQTMKMQRRLETMSKKMDMMAKEKTRENK